MAFLKNCEAKEHSPHDNTQLKQTDSAGCSAGERTDFLALAAPHLKRVGLRGISWKGRAMLYCYTTNRLELKILSEDAAALTTEFFLRNRAHFSSWEMEYPPEYFTEEYQRRTLAAESVQHLRSHAVRYYFFLPGEKIPIGTASFSHIELAPSSGCCLGYRLDRDFVGRGYMTEALRFLIPKVFFFYRLHRMEANVLPENTRSLRLLNRLGFTSEGVARGFALIGGKYCDHLRYSLLAEDIFLQDGQKQ